MAQALQWLADSLLPNSVEHDPEYLRCAQDTAYFIGTYCRIYDATFREWIPFGLWPAQEEVLDTFHEHRQVVVLKARQLGLTWLALGYALWLMRFHPVATILIFSRRDDEAVYLLSDERLRGMYAQLPLWLQIPVAIGKDNDHTFGLNNGSVARALPTTAGDSYTVSLVICDEYDLVDDQNGLMRKVKPTVTGGGKIFLISRADKTKPNSDFKRTYRAAVEGKNDWAAVFLPWHARPSRDEAWYEAEKRDIFERTGGFDELHEQYPATDVEALAPPSLDKRIPGHWLEKCYAPRRALTESASTDLEIMLTRIPGLEVYQPPVKGRTYVIGTDCAEGLASSDDSVSAVIDRLTGEEVAVLAGKLTPATHAQLTITLADWYHRCPVLVERNNHGHAFIGYMREHGHAGRILAGPDKRPGWHSTTLGKTLMYDALAEAARGGEVLLHSIETYTQIQSVEKSTLRAPQNGPDDRADAYALAIVARTMGGSGRGFAH